MEKTCANPWCKTSFKVSADDLEFYDKVSPAFGEKKYLIPPPTLCPPCRQERRLGWRNERSLHRRTCSTTKKPIISIYHAEDPFPVFTQDYWYSDAWNPLTFGRPYDFSKPFFRQFAELQRVVPRIGMLAMGNENSDFVNLSSWNRDCYLIYESDNNQNCFYSDHTYVCRDCVDVSYLNRCQLCHECLYCMNCYNCTALQNCENCSDCHLCKNCVGCKNCIGCVNLRNKEYCFFNEELSKEEFQKRKTAMSSEQQSQKFQQFREQFPVKYYEGHGNEGCTGDYLWNSKDSSQCFDVHNVRDCRHVYNCENSRDCRDTDVYGGQRGMELIYEGNSVGNGALRCSFNTCLFEDTTDVYYSDFCHTSSFLFGCIGLRHASHCILNKKYTKEEYEELMPRIIAHMRTTGEWGEFFPVSVSPHPFNETVAYEYFPIERDEALKRGYAWRERSDDISGANKVIPGAKLPALIDDIPDDILNWAIQCEKTQRPFRIIKQELSFYREHHLPVPRLHPDERYKRRLALRNPRKLWQRNCAKCAKEIQTTYSSDRKEIVYCEECYLKEVY